MKLRDLFAQAKGAARIGKNSPTGFGPDANVEI